MDWLKLLAFSVLGLGGFIAATYEEFAKQNGYRIGRSFFLNRMGIFAVLGGILGLSSFVLTFIFNPWWSIFIILFIAIIVTPIFVNLFKVFSQPISIILMLLGLILTTILII